MGNGHHVLCAWTLGVVGDGDPEQEHVWNISIGNKEVTVDSRPLLREGVSRNGGDLLHVGRVT